MRRPTRRRTSRKNVRFFSGNPAWIMPFTQDMRILLSISVLVVGACTEPVAETPDDAPVYLALGDSVAFGFDPRIDQHMTDGYPELLSQRRGVEVTNAACPGEATGGFISIEGNDNHCRENRVAYPLHVQYDGTQLAFALEFLAAHPGTELVTIDIGGNDASKLNTTCAGDQACILGGFVPMLLEYGTNLDLILGELRKVYDGPIVGLSIYNPMPSDSLFQYGLERMNTVFAEKLAAWDALLADGAAAFAAAAAGADPCTAGLLIGMPDGTCDIHPSLAGDNVLVDAIEAALR
jgi:lysophospholipase L1-like esterase